MIHLKEGNILEATEDIIVHQVNCQGVMGAGLAKQIRDKYPNVYNDYKWLVSQRKDKKSLLGTVQYISVNDSKTVVNLFGQDTYGRTAGKVYTDYRAIEDGLKSIYDLATNTFSAYKGKSIALPYGIGCGLAGGDWNVVYKVIDEVFKNHEVTLYKFQ